jgi:hypothetical protein
MEHLLGMAHCWNGDGSVTVISNAQAVAPRQHDHHDDKVLMHEFNVSASSSASLHEYHLRHLVMCFANTSDYFGR